MTGYARRSVPRWCAAAGVGETRQRIAPGSFRGRETAFRADHGASPGRPPLPFLRLRWTRGRWTAASSTTGGLPEQGEPWAIVDEERRGAPASRTRMRASTRCSVRQRRRHANGSPRRSVRSELGIDAVQVDRGWPVCLLRRGARAPVGGGNGRRSRLRAVEEARRQARAQPGVRPAGCAERVLHPGERRLPGTRRRVDGRRRRARRAALPTSITTTAWVTGTMPRPARRTPAGAEPGGRQLPVAAADNGQQPAEGVHANPMTLLRNAARLLASPAGYLLRRRTCSACAWRDGEAAPGPRPRRRTPVPGVVRAISSGQPRGAPLPEHDPGYGAIRCRSSGGGCPPEDALAFIGWRTATRRKQAAITPTLYPLALEPLSPVLIELTPAGW